MFWKWCQLPKPAIRDISIVLGSAATTEERCQTFIWCFMFVKIFHADVTISAGIQEFVKRVIKEFFDEVHAIEEYAAGVNVKLAKEKAKAEEVAKDPNMKLDADKHMAERIKEEEAKATAFFNNHLDKEISLIFKGVKAETELHQVDELQHELNHAWVDLQQKYEVLRTLENEKSEFHDYADTLKGEELNVLRAKNDIGSLSGDRV